MAHRIRMHQRFSDMVGLKADRRPLRACEKIGSQAKAPAPPDRKSLRVNVGQALPPANSALIPIFSRLLTLAARN